MLSFRLALDRVVDGTLQVSPRHQWALTSTNVRIVPDPEGRFSGYALFDGESSMVKVSDITCPPNFTFTVWVKRDVGISFYYATILAFGRDSPYFGLYRGRPALANSLTLSNELGTSWCHVAVAQDQHGSKIYVNGELMGSSASRATTSGVGLGIGCDLTRGHTWFRGTMAEIMIFDEALSAVAISRLMAAPGREPLGTLAPAPSLPAPALPSLSYTEHVPLLHGLHEAFPAPALIELITALEEGADPRSLSPDLAGSISSLGVWSFQVDVEPLLLLGVGDGPLVALSGPGGGAAPALCVEIYPPSHDLPGRMCARLKGRLQLLNGAVSADIDEEVHPDGGVRVRLSGGVFGEAAETTLLLRSSRRCEVALRSRFSHSIGIRGQNIRLPLSASMSLTIDGALFQQHIAYILDMAGEELVVSVPHPHPIMSAQELVGVFTDTALSALEHEIYETLERRGAEALAWLRQRLAEALDHDLRDTALLLFRR